LDPSHILTSILAIKSSEKCFINRLLRHDDVGNAFCYCGKLMRVEQGVPDDTDKMHGLL
jgi:hypothetical protein